MLKCYVVDQQPVLFNRRILTSCNIILRILVYLNQDVILPYTVLFGKIQYTLLLSSRDTFF